VFCVAVVAAGAVAAVVFDALYLEYRYTAPVPIPIHAHVGSGPSFLVRMFFDGTGGFSAAMDSPPDPYAVLREVTADARACGGRMKMVAERVEARRFNFTHAHGHFPDTHVRSFRV
jgi:hypothetical protein